MQIIGDDWNKMMDVKEKGILLDIKYAIPYARWDSVINAGSVAGVIVYCG